MPNVKIKNPKPAPCPECGVKVLPVRMAISDEDRTLEKANGDGAIHVAMDRGYMVPPGKGEWRPHEVRCHGST